MLWYKPVSDRNWGQCLHLLALSGDSYFHMPWLIPPGTVCNDNFNIAAQHRQKTEQAINRKTGQLATYQVGNLGLVNTQQIGRFRFQEMGSDSIIFHPKCPWISPTIGNSP